MSDTTKVLWCTCDSAYQDKAYGGRMRLHNKMGKDGSWRCTVCERENTSGSAPKAVKASKDKKK